MTFNLCKNEQLFSISNGMKKENPLLVKGEKTTIVRNKGETIPGNLSFVSARRSVDLDLDFYVDFGTDIDVDFSVDFILILAEIHWIVLIYFLPQVEH